MSGGIPIVGVKRFVICPQGHVDELPGAFTMFFPSQAQAPPAREDAVQLCRICVMGFLSMSFPCRVSPATSLKEALGEIARWKTELRATGDSAGLEGQIVHGDT